MMRTLLYVAVYMAISLATTAQTKFNIAFNAGFGSLPTYTQYADNEVLTMQQAEALFKYAKDSSGIEWRYSYAGCEKRAHAVSLLLNGKKVKHYKIWNFDPALISIFNKQQQPTVKSKVGLSPTISWGYHVAILVFVKVGTEAKPMVIDPALDNKILTQKAWLDLQNAPNSYYTYLDPQWYTFTSTDKYKYYCSNVPYQFPPCMHALFTGDFFLNDGISRDSLWVEEALAVNEIAVNIIDQVINKEPANSAKRKAFVDLVENFDNLTNALKASPPAEVSAYSGVFAPYQAKFIALRGAWKTKLDKFR